MDNKIKHLEMIQAVIQRMANNSFQLKGWAVTLIGIIGAISAQGSDRRFFLLAFIPLVVFWGLDSLYLQLERKFTILYKNVAGRNENNIDFNMDLREIEYVDNLDEKRVKFYRCLFSRTEVVFYGALVLAVLILAIVLI